VSVDNIFGDERLELSDLLSHVLDKGVVLKGEVMLAVADIDLVRLDLGLLLTAVETVLGHRRGFYGLVAAGWILIGPGHKWLQTLLVSGYSNLLMLRLMAEFGVLGVIAIWIAALVAVRRERAIGRF